MSALWPQVRPAHRLARSLRALLWVALVPAHAFLTPGTLAGAALPVGAHLLDVDPLGADSLGAHPLGADPLGTSTPTDEAVWAAGLLTQVLARGDVPGLLALATWIRLEGPPAVGETSPPPPPELLDGILRSLATGDDAILPPGLHRCRAELSPVDAALCSMELLVPRLPARAGVELTEEGRRLLTLYREASRGDANGGDSWPGWLPALVSGPSGGWMGPQPVGVEGRVLSPLQRYAEGVLDEATRYRDRLPGLSELTWEHPTALEFRSLVERGRHDLMEEGESLVAEYRALLSAVGDAPGRFQGSVEGRLQAGAGAVEDAVRGRLAWAEERSLAYLASRSALLSGLEEGAARRLQALGEAAADLRLEGRSFGANVLNLGRDTALSLLSGNVVGVAAGVAAFFEATPGGLGMGAAGDVRALRDELDALRLELAERHGVVELRLDALLDSVDQGMARLEGLVVSNHREVRSELGQLRRSLEALEGRLEQTEATLAAYMQAGFDRDHARTLVRCLEHRNRHLPPFDEMDFGTFAGCLTEFRVRGERDARDALLADRTTPVDDASVREALADPSTENLARRLPLLARVGAERYGHGALAGRRAVANPLEWRLAAEAYLAMLEEWPEHARGVAPGDLEALLTVGIEVEGVLRSVAGTGETDESGGVWGAALAEYRRHLDDLVQEADALATRHRQAQLRRVNPASLLNRIHPDDGVEGRDGLEVPEWLRRAIPPEVRTAAVLALEEPELVYRTSVSHEVTRENFRRRFLFWQRHERRTTARGTLEVELRLDQTRSVWVHRVELPPFLRRLETMSGGEDSGSIRRVLHEEPDPHGYLLRSQWPQAARGVEGWTLGSPRPGLRAELDRAIAAELRRFESASLTRVFGAVCEARPGESGELAGLGGADAASAVRIRSALEGLSTTRTLLAAYVGVGLPGALEQDEELRGLLTGEGDRALLDRGGLCGAVEEGGSALRVVWLEEAPRERAERAAQIIAERVQMQAGPTRVVDAVERTNSELRAAIRLQRLRAQAASRALAEPPATPSSSQGPASRSPR